MALFSSKVPPQTRPKVPPNSRFLQNVETQAAATKAAGVTGSKPSSAGPGLFTAQSSETPTACATPAPQQMPFTTASEQELSALPATSIRQKDREHIDDLIQQQLDRLEYEYKHAFFISKNLNRKKYDALTALKDDLNDRKFLTYEDLTQRLRKTSNDKDVVKGIIFRSKVNGMFQDIYQYLADYGRTKLILAGVRKSVVAQLPNFIKFDVLYQKIKCLTYHTHTYTHHKNTDLELWMLAFLSGDEKFIQTAKAAKHTLQKTTSSGLTILHFAALGGNVKIFKNTLKSSKKAVDSKDKLGRTPLHFAALSNSQELFEHILKHLKTPLDNKDASGATPLHYAALGGNLPLVKEIIECQDLHYKIDNRIDNGIDNDDVHALHYAALGGNSKVFAYLASAHDRNQKDLKGARFEHYAALGGHVHFMESIFKNFSTADCIHSKDKEGNGLLNYAILGGHADAVQFLRKKYNFDPHLKNQQGADAFAIAKDLSRAHKQVGEAILAALHIPLKEIPC